MNNSATVFPEINPTEPILFPLIQLFDEIVYIRPVENNDPVDEESKPFLPLLRKQGLVRSVCPAPLAENRDRFLHLIHDLQNRRDDYAGQLGSLSLAGMSDPGNNESKSSIISSLLKQGGIKDGDDQEREKILWQARLVLKLGEMLDLEQQELQQSMNRIANREKGLFDELRKEQNQPFALTEPDNSPTVTDSQMRLRLKAWARLFGLGEQPVEGLFFVTANRDGFDLLLEQYELSQQEKGVQKNQTTELLTIQLPAVVRNDDVLEQRTGFREAGAELLEYFQTIGGQDSQDDPAPYLSQWEELLEQHYPAAEYGRCTLTIHALPEMNPAKLFIDTFGRDADELPDPVAKRLHTVFLGLLSCAD